MWGPAPILSVDNKSYYVLFVDQFTKYSWIFLLKHKNEVVTVFKNFQTLVKNYFQQKIRSLYTNGGGEYEGLHSYLAAQGIEHLKSPPYTPQ